jgi:hypothetical protein
MEIGLMELVDRRLITALTCPLAAAQAQASPVFTRSLAGEQAHIRAIWAVN